MKTRHSSSSSFFFFSAHRLERRSEIQEDHAIQTLPEDLVASAIDVEAPSLGGVAPLLGVGLAEVPGAPGIGVWVGGCLLGGVDGAQAVNALDGDALGQEADGRVGLAGLGNG